MFDYNPPSEQCGRFGGRPDLGQLCQDRVTNRNLVIRQETVRRTDDELEILAFTPRAMIHVHSTKCLANEWNSSHLAPESRCG